MERFQLSLPYSSTLKFSDNQKCKLIMNQAQKLSVSEWEINKLLLLVKEKSWVANGLAFLYEYAGIVDKLRSYLVSYLMLMKILSALDESNTEKSVLEKYFLILSFLYIRIYQSISYWRRLQWLPRPIYIEYDNNLLLLTDFLQFSQLKLFPNNGNPNNASILPSLEWLIRLNPYVYRELWDEDVLTPLNEIQSKELFLANLWNKERNNQLFNKRENLLTLRLPYQDLHQQKGGAAHILVASLHHGSPSGDISNHYEKNGNKLDEWFKRGSSRGFFGVIDEFLRTFAIDLQLQIVDVNPLLIQLNEPIIPSHSLNLNRWLPSVSVPTTQKNKQQNNNSNNNNSFKEEQGDEEQVEDEGDDQNNDIPEGEEHRDNHGREEVDARQFVSHENKPFLTKQQQEEPHQQQLNSFDEDRQEQEYEEDQDEEGAEIDPIYERNQSAESFEDNNNNDDDNNDEPQEEEKKGSHSNYSSPTNVPSSSSPSPLSSRKLANNNSNSSAHPIDGSLSSSPPPPNNQQQPILRPFSARTNSSDYYSEPSVMNQHNPSEYYDQPEEQQQEEELEEQEKEQEPEEEEQQQPLQYQRPTTVSQLTMNSTTTDVFFRPESPSNDTVASEEEEGTNNNNGLLLQSYSSSPPLPVRLRFASADEVLVKDHYYPLHTLSEHQQYHPHHQQHQSKDLSQPSVESIGQTNRPRAVSDGDALLKSTSPSKLLRKEKGPPRNLVIKSPSHHHKNHHEQSSSPVATIRHAVHENREKRHRLALLQTTLAQVRAKGARSKRDLAVNKLIAWYRIIFPRRKLLRRINGREAASDIIDFLFERMFLTIGFRERKRKQLLKQGAAMRIQRFYRSYIQQVIQEEEDQEIAERIKFAHNCLEIWRRCTMNAIRIFRFIRYCHRKGIIKRQSNNGNGHLNGNGNINGNVIGRKSSFTSRRPTSAGRNSTISIATSATTKTTSTSLTREGSGSNRVRLLYSIKQVTEKYFEIYKIYKKFQFHSQFQQQQQQQDQYYNNRGQQQQQHHHSRHNRQQQGHQLNNNRRLKVYRQMDRAAINIQRYFRGYRGRESVRLLRYQRKMAMTIGYFLYFMIARRKRKAKLLIFSSATKIQKFFRGIFIRRRIFTVVSAGLKLNALWRRHVAYKSLKSQLRRVDRPLTIVMHGLRNISEKLIHTGNIRFKISIWWNPLLHIVSNNDFISILQSKQPQLIYMSNYYKVVSNEEQQQRQQSGSPTSHLASLQRQLSFSLGGGGGGGAGGGSGSKKRMMEANPSLSRATLALFNQTTAGNQKNNGGGGNNNNNGNGRKSVISPTGPMPVINTVNNVIVSTSSMEETHDNNNNGINLGGGGGGNRKSFVQASPLSLSPHRGSRTSMVILNNNNNNNNGSSTNNTHHQPGLTSAAMSAIPSHVSSTGKRSSAASVLTLGGIREDVDDEEEGEEEEGDDDEGKRRSSDKKNEGNGKELEEEAEEAGLEGDELDEMKRKSSNFTQFTDLPDLSEGIEEDEEGEGDEDNGDNINNNKNSNNNSNNNRKGSAMSEMSTETTSAFSRKNSQESLSSQSHSSPDHHRHHRLSQVTFQSAQLTAPSQPKIVIQQRRTRLNTQLGGSATTSPTNNNTNEMNNSRNNSFLSNHSPFSASNSLPQIIKNTTSNDSNSDNDNNNNNNNNNQQNSPKIVLSHRRPTHQQQQQQQQQQHRQSQLSSSLPPLESNNSSTSTTHSHSHSHSPHRGTRATFATRAPSPKMSMVRQTLNFALQLGSKLKKTNQFNGIMSCDFEDDVIKIPGAHGNSAIKFEVLDGE
jgi:hypothetical protein